MKFRKSLVVAVVIGACFMAPSFASAATVNVAFCFRLDTDYDDLTDGDYWTTDNYRTAYGVWAWVVRNQDGHTMFNTYTSSATGCTTFLQLDTTKNYSVRVYAKSRDSNSNKVHVYQGSEGTTYHYQWVISAYYPTSDAIEYLTYQIVDSDHETNVLAAASYALRQHPAGLSSRDFYFYTETPDGGGARHSDGVVYLDQVAKDAKTGTTHELGHAVGYMRNGDQGAYMNYSDNGFENCLSEGRPHRISSREWQTAAAGEGNAHFYAAVTWNDGAEYDCMFRYYDCEGGIDFQIDWLSQCHGDLDNKGNELDWLRFWWDLHTDESVSVVDIFDIWNGANPHDWSASNVYQRLRYAAATQGVNNDTWDYWGVYHGVCHGNW